MNNRGNERPLPRREQQHSGFDLPARAGFSPAGIQIICCLPLASIKNGKLLNNFLLNSLGLLTSLRWQ